MIQISKNLIIALMFLFLIPCYAVGTTPDEVAKILEEYNDGVPVLGKEPSEEEMQLVRDGAQGYCEEKEDDAREECVMDYYAAHNLDEEPDCD